MDIRNSSHDTEGPEARKLTRYERELNKLVRAELGVSRAPYPIQYLSGWERPELRGRSWYYTTKTGIYVRSPNAYRRAAPSARLIYNGSTRHIVVGLKYASALYFKHRLRNPGGDKAKSSRSPQCPF